MTIIGQLSYGQLFYGLWTIILWSIVLEPKNFSIVSIIQPFHQNSDLKCRFGSADGKFIYTNASLQNQTTDDILHLRQSVLCGEVQVCFVTFIFIIFYF